MTNYQELTVRDIHRHEAELKSRIEADGFRDEIFVMLWPDGLVEVRGQVALPRRTTRNGIEGVKEIVRRRFGSGSLVKLEKDHVQGRPVWTYGVK